MTVRYIAFVHEDLTGGFSVSFPDVPGCNTFGDTVEDALKAATEALSGNLGVSIDAGDPLPKPTSFGELGADARRKSAFSRGDALMVLVEADPDLFRSIRVNVNLPRDLLRRIDAVARNRSRFLVEAAKEKLAVTL
jgi:predicted RNase H-like HicB family nuclease